MSATVRNNAARNRYELEVDGHLAIAVYTLAPGVITFVHTEVPAELGGKGVGSTLVRGALEDVRRQGAEGGGAVLVRPRLHDQAPRVQRPPGLTVGAALVAEFPSPRASGTRRTGASVLPMTHCGFRMPPARGDRERRAGCR